MSRVGSPLHAGKIIKYILLIELNGQFYLVWGEDISLGPTTPEKEELLPGKHGGDATHGEYM